MPESSSVARPTVQGFFDPNTNKLSNPIFGQATEKQGKRIVQVALKFYF